MAAEYFRFTGLGMQMTSPTKKGPNEAPNENLTQNRADPPHAYFNSHILFTLFVTEKNHLK